MREISSIKKGFKFEEAILMANFAKQVYEIFQYDDSNVEDSELKDIYALPNLVC